MRHIESNESNLSRVRAMKMNEPSTYNGEEHCRYKKVIHINLI